MKRVVILQEYVPAYRVPFFRALRERCQAADIELSIYGGVPNREQAHRGDSAHHLLTVGSLKQRELRVLGRRLTWRALPDVCRQSDLLVIEQARRNLDAYRLLLPRALWPAPRIAMWGHGRDYVHRRSTVESRLSEALTRRVDHFFAYTKGGAQHVVDLGRDPCSVTVVRNSVDTTTFAAELDSISSQELDDFRRRHALSNRTFLFVGGLDTDKRIDFLLEAAKRVATTDTSFRLVVVGDGSHRPIVEEVAASNSSIVYLGRLSGRDKALAFKAARALVVPGRVGLIAVESIAAGIPILTTDWPFHAPEFEYLVPGDSVFVSGNSVPEFAALVSRVAASPELVDNAKKALNAFAPDFGIDQMADNFIHGIRSALTLAARSDEVHLRTAVTVTHILGELRPSGAEVMLLDGAEWFARHGTRTRVISTGAVVGPLAGAFRAAGVEVVHIPFKGNPSFLRNLSREVPTSSVAHVHTERASFWVCLALKLRGIAVARSIHTVFRFRGHLRFRRMSQRQILRLIGVQFVSIDDQVSNNERHRFWLKTRVIRNFAGDQFIQHPHPRLTEAPSRLISVGNCADAKNHEAILEAVALNRERGIIWTYAHMGAEDRAETNERELARQLSINDLVDFMGHGDPINELKKADVFVMPSRYEGLGIAALEAISHGMPVLLADSPGLRAFKEAPGVWWCSPEAPSIAEQLGKIRATPAQELERRAAAARDWALSEFSRERSLRGWLDIYQTRKAAR